MLSYSFINRDDPQSIAGEAAINLPETNETVVGGTLLPTDPAAALQKAAAANFATPKPSAASLGRILQTPPEHSAPETLPSSP